MAALSVSYCQPVQGLGTLVVIQYAREFDDAPTLTLNASAGRHMLCSGSSAV